jgi:hypothetical protein
MRESIFRGKYFAAVTDDWFATATTGAMESFNNRRVLEQNSQLTQKLLIALTVRTCLLNEAHEKNDSSFYCK